MFLSQEIDIKLCQSYTKILKKYEYKLLETFNIGQYNLQGPVKNLLLQEPVYQLVQSHPNSHEPRNAEF